MTVKDFVHEYIKRRGSPGLNVYKSGFNTVFRQKFPGKNPRRECEKLEESGDLVIDHKHNTLIFYLPEDMPEEYRKTLQELEEAVEGK